jgi:hypothetical protein
VDVIEGLQKPPSFCFNAKRAMLVRKGAGRSRRPHE